MILYDHRHFSSDYSIGGLRFCVPFKKDDRKLLLFSQIDDLSLQDRCRSLSPAHNSYSKLIKMRPEEIVLIREVS